jgi:hypothetical protein
VDFKDAEARLKSDLVISKNGWKETPCQC